MHTAHTEITEAMFLPAGETGIGKSTLIDTLFNTSFDSTPSSHDLPSVKLKSHTYGIYILSSCMYNVYMYTLYSILFLVGAKFNSKGRGRRSHKGVTRVMKTCVTRIGRVAHACDEK